MAAGNTVVIGTPSDDSTGQLDNGCVHVFVRTAPGTYRPQGGQRHALRFGAERLLRCAGHLPERRMPGELRPEQHGLQSRELHQRDSVSDRVLQRHLDELRLGHGQLVRSTNNGGCSTMPMVTCTNTIGGRLCGGCPSGYAGNGMTLHQRRRVRDRYGQLLRVRDLHRHDRLVHAHLQRWLLGHRHDVRRHQRMRNGHEQLQHECGVHQQAGHVHLLVQRRLRRQRHDECSLAADNCTTTQACTNSVGSFVCTNCDANASVRTVGGVEACVCDSGYGGDGQTCTANACAPACGTNAVCGASFTCSCPAGYEGDPLVACNDVDECALGTDDCSANANCINTVGWFSCACKTGFTGDGRTCTDVDECGLGTDTCSPNATCTNTAGGYLCACSPS